MVDKEKVVFTGGVGTKQKKAAREMMDQWFAAKELCATQIGKARAKAKDTFDDIIDRAERMGVKRTVFKGVMKKADLINKAKECDADLEDDLAHVFHTLELALDMPLFDAAGVEAPPDRKPRKPRSPAAEAAQDLAGGAENVHDLASHRQAEPAVA